MLLFNTIFDVCIILAGLGGIVGVLFPRHTIWHWWQRRKLRCFTTAASLLEYLEAQGSPLPGFSYNDYADECRTTFYTTGTGLHDVSFRLSKQLKEKILTLEPTASMPHTRFYQNEALLPLARREKLRLLVS